MSNAASSDQFCDYFSNATNGAILVAFSSINIMAMAVGADIALTSIGVITNDIQGRGSLAFIAQKGYISKLVYSKRIFDECAATAYVNVALTGKFLQVLQENVCHQVHRSKTE
jgi:hypothetical protein